LTFETHPNDEKYTLTKGRVFIKTMALQPQQ